MSDQQQQQRRTKEEWFSLIQQCRKSGMTDTQRCLANGISRYTFNNAIKRLRKCSYAKPSKSPRDIYDLTSSKHVRSKMIFLVGVIRPQPHDVKQCLTFAIENTSCRNDIDLKKRILCRTADHLRQWYHSMQSKAEAMKEI